MKIAIAFALLLTGAAPASRAVKIESVSATLEFTSAWPAEAAAIPALDRHLRAAADTALRAARKSAAEELTTTRREKREFHKQSYLMQWSAAGRSKRLLSLQSERFTFEGGAHPNTDYGALLWDRALARDITVDSLFAAPGSLAAATRTRYCAALSAERLKRRQGMKLGGEFDECPKNSELAISPVESDKDGSFETLDFVASPDTAGPYAEGEYEIALPIRKALIAALKPEFRGSFEAQPQ